jgi:hypothetical protein
MESSKVSVKKLLSIMCAGFALLMSQRPGLANSPKLIHTESVGQITIPTSGVVFGPSGCDPTTPGSCLFVNLNGTVAGENSVLGPFKSTISATLLLAASTPSGANNDGAASVTSSCRPELGSQIDTFADGSTLSSNFQGLSCCTAMSCPFEIGAPSVNHDSSVITEGTGRLTGTSGGWSWSDNQGSLTGPLLMHAEGVLQLPGSSD